MRPLSSNNPKIETSLAALRTIAAILAIPACLSAAPGADDAPAADRNNLLINGGFEQHTGIGTIPTGWHVRDENLGYFGWIAPRVERTIGGIRPRTGRYMIGLATDMMGVDTNGKEYPIPRAAIFQTITVKPNTRGTFSLFYNDLGSTALSHLPAIRLAYTINSTNISAIRFPAPFHDRSEADQARPGVWSNPHFRVSQKLPRSQTAVGDWTLASMPVVVESTAPQVELTLWIGIFDHQDSTELGYYRIDDASFVLDHPRQTPATRPAR